MKDSQLYQSTIDVWGEQAQYDQTAEECAELIAVLMHYRRGKVDEQQVIDELADVILMTGQLKWMFGAERVEDAVRRKRCKLDELMQHADAGSGKGSD
ncbi:MAG: antitoxin [Desulfobacteraceae bacterium 4572_35.1]|nr:MAG: antitoxin [Desulfobacteraceae bacterium 4572_35.1]